MKTKRISGEIKAIGDIEFILTTEVVDRDGDLLRISGISLENFLKNPVMFYNHNSWEAIGYWRNLRIENNTLIGVPEFSKSELGEKIKSQVEDRTLRACSIGFMIKSEGLENIDGQMVNVIYEAELYEASIVTLPANQDAIRIKELNKGEVMEEKAGAKLSKKNKELLLQAVENIKAVMEIEEEEETEEKYIELEKQIETIYEKLVRLESQINEKKISLQEYLRGNNE